jgi:hypothetical protein
MKMKAMCSCKHVRQKEECGMKQRISEMVKIDGEAYTNGSVRGRNIFKNAHKHKHTGKCKGRQ